MSDRPDTTVQTEPTREVSAKDYQTDSIVAVMEAFIMDQDDYRGSLQWCPPGMLRVNGEEASTLVRAWLEKEGWGFCPLPEIAGGTHFGYVAFRYEWQNLVGQAFVVSEA